MAKKYIIGLDLGTTNSCVAIMEGKTPTVINSQEGSKTVPSVVSYKDEEKTVGALAKRQAITNPKRTLYSTKRFIGRSYDESASEISVVPYEVVNEGGSPAFKVDGKNIRPEQVSANILEKLKEVAQSYIGKDGEIEGAVITVPAYFNNTQKQSTMDAGVIAGLDVKRLINEPTAAAIAYGLDKGNEQKNIAVFDFGGGTFDVSVLEIGDGVIEVKATSGNNHLGGDDIDNVLINYIADNFKKDHGIDLKKDPMALQRVKEAAETCKKELSESLSSEIILPFITMSAEGPQHLNLTMTRNKFEELIQGILEKLVEPCESAINKSGILKRDIHTVLAVGGSTRIPAVREKAKQIFGKDLDHTKDPDTVVAEGAAIQAGILSGDISDIVLLDTLPIAIGIETEGGIFTPIIEEGKTIPTHNKQVFTTAADNQTSVTIRVLQGASELAARNQEIGRFDLNGIAPAPRGKPQIEVKFEITSNGVLNCSAKDVETNVETNTTITAKNGLSDEIVAELKKEAEKHREEDAKKTALIHAKHEAQSTVKQAEESLKTYEDKIPQELKEEISASSESLKSLEETSSNAEEIKAKTKELQEKMQKIGEIVYANAQSQGAQHPDSKNEDQQPPQDEVV